MIILCMLLLISIIARILAGSVHLRDPAGQEEFIALVDQMQPLTTGENTIREKKLFAFNPNTISDTDLESLQIPEKIAGNLLRYRQKGGRFRKAEDMRKLYGMTDSLYQVIRPFIRLESLPAFHEPVKAFGTEGGKTRRKSDLLTNKGIDSVFNSQVKERKIIRLPTDANMPGKEENVIELNSADSVDLLQLPGIGPVFAGRIIRYRKILGGFCSVDQLSEVYGMTPEKTERLEGLIRVDRSLIVPIRINFADYNLLSRHPYVTGNDAKKIIDWRAANGPFPGTAELLKNRILDSVQFRKLEHYLSCP